MKKFVVSPEYYQGKQKVSINKKQKREFAALKNQVDAEIAEMNNYMASQLNQIRNIISEVRREYASRLYPVE